jgi:glyoxylase-like metal-dependent hydrolase (beta-lactamase superfamily II)
MLDAPLSDLTAGRPVRIAPGAWRVVAPNASAMTGPGTNCYVLGDPPTAMIDPGPDDAGHIDTLLGLAPGVDTVFVTHTHKDHSPAAARIAARTGARLVGRPPPGDGRQDMSFEPRHVPQRDELFAIGALRLRAIDTPGHASNHVCYLLDDAGLLFSGDHVLDGVTPVILAPDGDLAAYLEALQRLKGYPLRAIAPGHGRLLSEPNVVIDGVIAHRGRREAAVLAAIDALEAGGRCATPEALLDTVYAGLDPALRRFARATLEAHLIKLEREGRVRREGEGWHAA